MVGHIKVNMLVIFFKNIILFKVNVLSCFIKVIVDDMFAFNGRMVLDSDVECVFENVPRKNPGKDICVGFWGKYNTYL